MPTIPSTIGHHEASPVAEHRGDDHEDPSQILELFPFSTSDRHRIAHARTAADVDWVTDAYGPKLAGLIRQTLFPSSQGINVTIDRARYCMRHKLDQLGLSDHLPSIPVDAQTAMMLAEEESPLNDILEYLVTLPRNIERGINSVQTHRSGITNGNGETTTEFIPDALNTERATHLYLTSVAQISAPTNRQEQFQRSARERKQAFRLFQEILEAPSLSGLEKSDLYGILEICFRLTSGQRPEFLMTTGFGTSEDAPSTRLPSYLTGAVELMQIFARHQQRGAIAHLPTFRVLLAPKLAGQVNAMDQERLDQTAESTGTLLLAFLERFAPELSENVIIETDHRITYPERDEVGHYFAGIDAEDPARAKIQAQADRMMRKDRLSSQEDAVARVEQYIAAHVALFMDAVSPRWHSQTRYADQLPDVVWSVGGKGEAFFNHFRRRFRDLLVDQSNGDVYFPLSVRTLQKQGQHPPYYHLRGVDVSMGDVTNAIVLPDWRSLTEKAVRNSLQADITGLVGIVRQGLANEREVAVSRITDADVTQALARFYSEHAPRMHAPLSDAH